MRFPTKDNKALWPRLKEDFLKSNPKSREVLGSWLSQLSMSKALESETEIQLTFQIPSPLHKKWVLERLIPHLKSMSDKNLSVRFQLSNTQKTKPFQLIFNKKSGAEKTKKGKALFSPDYKFENFIVGRNSEFAYGACLQLAQPGEKDFNPLFLYGPSGVGKTHLLNSLGWKALSFKKKILYLSAERFLNECIYSIQKREMKSFRKKYRHSCDMLLIDDIQMIGRGVAVQEEFFHTFNELFYKKIPIAVCCDSPPKEVPGLEERLKTRLEGGLAVEIGYPDIETRMAILKAKAEKKNLRLSLEALQLIAESCKKSVREMEGIINKIKMLNDLQGGALRFSSVQQILKHIKKPPPSIIEIQKETAKAFQISMEEMISSSRKKPIITARCAAMRLLKTQLGKSLSDIGRIFGKDHSTVLNSLKKAERMHKSSSDFQHTLKKLEKFFS